MQFQIDLEGTFFKEITINAKNEQDAVKIIINRFNALNNGKFHIQSIEVKKIK